MTNPAILIGIGVLVGIYSGIMGLGGGTVMIPVLVLLLGFTQHQAVATSLAVMIPPVTLPAVIAYWREGHVNLRIAIWMAIGFAAGAYLGAFAANHLRDNTMKLIFGFILVYVGGYTLFNTLGREHLVRNMIVAGVLVVIAAAAYGALRAADARESQSPTAQRSA
ncbi:MAG TPA: sulfite exporter TauE/SafE family protein [Tepidisphaeraceae bacterium]|nr:sulfite exporter TauE/SafE family protein [Tepidisphaeraceae bacterium]